MKLIADSGSTKTDWRLLSNGGVIASFSTEGLNPYFKNTKEILEVLESEVLPYIEEVSKVSEIYFYGAGCSSESKNRIVLNAFKNVFKKAKTIEINHDLLGAAIALCGDKKGIVTILGTGSNSCVFDGYKIVEEQNSLGYILGDEGAGSFIGKQLMIDYLYGKIPQKLSDNLEKEFSLTKELILDKVYKQKLPNRYLAGFMPWIGVNIEKEHYLQSLVKNAFELFIGQHILSYSNYRGLPLNSVGSVGFYFQKYLKEVAEKQELTLGKVIQSPIDGMIEFYSKMI